ncbi:two component transcriptional regulator, LytTR family [Pseudoxanthobacter soli DSM 19599]|uniref:Two component transcriptional regulator, LytTR family n=1 Tax=Pseudoxanthobacter soli DSM 19599 TaxID=1123029 RepID=A0A1M7ZQS7_9HYPH|nr:LytTR family DNA-binding domain-containing protein [Pseudoxanthobacter soli]SHO67273.1 two component transcriptional regulator, LytTR family [Pseudoxanthobacter soli DSM 19599]
MLRVLIVDDEPLARRGLGQLLSEHASVAVVGEAGSIGDALTLIERQKPDAVFLDIELDENGDGFDLIGKLDDPPRIVFVTAYARHAVEAFAVEAVDFLLKPVSPARLAETLGRVQRLVAAGQTGSEEEGATIALRVPGRTVVAAHADIIALRADGDFTHVLLAGQPPLMILRTLTSFEEALPAPPFLRLGRSLIINFARLKSLETPSHGAPRIVLAGLADPLQLGRSAAARLRELLDLDATEA